jgi:hypothetical protein
MTKRRRICGPATLACVLLFASTHARAIVIDNGIEQGTVGSWTVDVQAGGEILVGREEVGIGAVLTALPLQSTEPVTGNVVYLYLSFVDTGNGQVNELSSDSPPIPDPNDPNSVTSSGTFTGASGNTIDWTVTSAIASRSPAMVNTIRFTAEQGTLGRLRFWQYLDEDVGGADQDIFFVRGSLGTGDLQLLTVNQAGVYGVGQSGGFSPAFGLVNGQFAGWAADTYDNLDPSIRMGQQQISLDGVIQHLQSIQDPHVGAAYGPADIVSVLAWDVDSSATTATIVTTLGGVPSATAFHCGDGQVEADAGEACDLGAANGLPGSCCTSDCQLRPTGSTCRPSAGACDVAETCDGSNPLCPDDAFLPVGTSCRTGAFTCDATAACTGQSPDCPPEAPAPKGTVCRPAAGPCDVAEVCDGSSTSCPADMRKLDGDACDDGDPTTGSSACQGGQCVGVAATVVVPPEIIVPPTKSPANVNIPVTIQIPNESGPNAARLALQGFVDCADLPASNRPAKCGQAGGSTAEFRPLVTSVFLPITPLVKKNLGRLRARSLTAKLPLTGLGRKLFAKLKAREQSRLLPAQVAAKIGDRRRPAIQEVFPVLLVRQRQ